VFGAPSILHELALPGLQELRFTYKDIFKHFAAEKYAALQKDLDALELADPLITFSEKLTLDLGDVSVKLVHVGGHSLGTIYVHVPDDKVLFTGDNVTCKRHPYMGEATFANWKRALVRMLMLDATIVVPGHGDVCDKDAVSKMKDFFALLEKRVTELRDAKKSRGHIVKQVAELVAFFPIVPGREKMIPEWVSDAMGRMYDELGG
jgi:glyoxylase-like metal-dependent hydrolase (beta-lactamase superfamily II)